MRPGRDCWKTGPVVLIFSRIWIAWLGEKKGNPPRRENSFLEMLISMCIFDRLMTGNCSMVVCTFHHVQIRWITTN